MGSKSKPENHGHLSGDVSRHSHLRPSATTAHGKKCGLNARPNAENKNSLRQIHVVSESYTKLYYHANHQRYGTEINANITRLRTPTVQRNPARTRPGCKVVVVAIHSRQHPAPAPQAPPQSLPHPGTPCWGQRRPSSPSPFVPQVGDLVAHTIRPTNGERPMARPAH